MDSLDTTNQQVSDFTGKVGYSNLEHLCNLNPRNPAVAVRKTSIICSIGPSCASPEILRELFKNGMNIARINLSYGTREDHIALIRMIREVSAEFPNEHVAIALDTKGPEIRTGYVKDGGTATIKLQKGSDVILTTNPEYMTTCTAAMIYIDYEDIARALQAGSMVYLDDGSICLRVKDVLPDGVRCVVENEGLLGSTKGVSLPDASIDLPTVTDRDREDIEMAVEQDVDMLFLSFITDAFAIKEIRIDMGNRGRAIKLIAKIENEDGVNNIDEILAEADGIMVARGDLGIEIATEKVFLAQKSIIAKCNIVGKPVICATQMLESMVKNPRATRAECSDVANAVLDGADCVMLSGETAKGAFPVQSLICMHQVCSEAEAAFYTMKFLEGILKRKPKRGKVETMALAATTAVLCSHATAMIVLSVTGITAHMVAKFRPPVPIVTLCKDKRMARQMHLWRGIVPLYSELVSDDSAEGIEKCLEEGIQEALKRKFVQRGDQVILISMWPGAVDYSTMMRVKAVE